MRRGHVVAGLCAALALGGCRRCSDAGAGADAKRNLASEPVHVGSPTKASLPELLPLESPRGYGLPSGCTLEGAITRGALAAGRTRFVAARSNLDALALASTADDAGSRVERAGFLDFGDKLVEPAPWGDLDAPPLFERAASGWIGAFSVNLEPGLDRVVLYRAHGPSEALAEGDHLSVADLACAGESCGALTSLARNAAAPGATLFFGKLSASTSAWRQVDLEPPSPEPLRPLSILGLGADGSGWVALSGDKSVALFELTAGRGSLAHRVEVPYPAYDGVLAKDPLVIAPGAAPNRACDKDEFPVLVLGPGGKRAELRTPAAPESVLALPLAHGAIVAWLAPVSCQFAERRVVYATLLRPDGSAASSPMAVADATGFALATNGDAISLWLASGNTLSRIRARCRGSD